MGLLGEKQPKIIVGRGAQIVEKYKQLLVVGNNFLHLGLAFYGSFKLIYLFSNAF